MIPLCIVVVSVTNVPSQDYYEVKQGGRVASS